MIKYLAFVMVVVVSACNHSNDVSSNTTPTVCVDGVVSADCPAPSNTGGPCGHLGEVCCSPIDPVALCNDGLYCDTGSNTCVAADMAMSAPADLSVVVDLSTPEDLSVAADMTVALDFSVPIDFTVAADFSVPLDMSVAYDMTVLPDMTQLPDFTVVQDFTVVADMSSLPDLTLPPPECDYNQNCTFSYGWYKNYWVCNWQSLTLGTVSYTHDQLLAILNQAVSGNGLVELAHQLIGAEMNIVKGADPSSIQSTINAANALIGSLVIPPIGSGSLTTGATNALAATLADFNLGNTGPGHCQ